MQSLSGGCGCLGCCEILANEIFLDLLQDLGLPLFERFNLDVLRGADDLLYFLVEGVPADKLYLVIDPVAPFLVKSLKNPIILLVSPLVIILHKVNKISLLENPSDPIPLHSIPQYPTTLEHIGFELPDVRVPVLEDLLAKPVQLAVNVIPLLDQGQLEIA